MVCFLSRLIGKNEFIRLNIREKWVVLMKSDDPLSKKETVSAKDLSVLPLILPRRMNVRVSWQVGLATTMRNWILFLPAI